jgi:hypothetical protein
MLTPGAERQAFEEQERMRRYARDYAQTKARRDVIRKHEAKFLDAAARQRFERLLKDCEKDADEIACKAAWEASGRASRTELSVPAYEVAFIEAYADALPTLVATALARRSLDRLPRLKARP